MRQDIIHRTHKTVRNTALPLVIATLSVGAIQPACTPATEEDLTEMTAAGVDGSSSVGSMTDGTGDQAQSTTTASDATNATGSAGTGSGAAQASNDQTSGSTSMATDDDPAGQTSTGAVLGQGNNGGAGGAGTAAGTTGGSTAVDGSSAAGGAGGSGEMMQPGSLSGGASPGGSGSTGTGTDGTGGMAMGGAGGAPPEAPLGCDWENPEGRIMLFDGTSLDGWENLRTGGPAQWQLMDDGSMEVVPLEPPTDMQTEMGFEDLCVHLEYLTPEYPSSVSGQSRGNSGVFLKRAYEMQILDSIGQPPAIDSCGAVYSIAAPLTVACNEELVWNTYEIEFKASVWDDSGTKIENAEFVEVRLNGQLVQQNVPMNPAGGFTQAGQPDAPGPQPLMLQDHRNRVRFRNIWVKVPRYE